MGEMCKFADLLRSIGIPAMHDTSLCGLVRVLASKDEYTELVKSGEVTSEHVRRIGSGMGETWIPRPLELCAFLMVM